MTSSSWMNSISKKKHAYWSPLSNAYLYITNTTIWKCMWELQKTKLSNLLIASWLKLSCVLFSGGAHCLVYTSPVQKHTFWVLVPYLFIKGMVNSLYKIPTFQNHFPQHVGGTSVASKTHSSVAHQTTPVLSKSTARCKDSMQNSQNRWVLTLPAAQQGTFFLGNLL